MVSLGKVPRRRRHVALGAALSLFALAGGSVGFATMASAASTFGTITIPAQGENHSRTVAPGTTIYAGYDFKYVAGTTVTVTNAQTVLNVKCADNGKTPSQSSLTIHMPDMTYIADNTHANGWVPTGNQSDMATYQGSLVLPSLCGTTGNTNVVVGTGQMGPFTADVESSGDVSDLSFRWHHEVAGDNGSSWSATKKVDPSTPRPGTVSVTKTVTGTPPLNLGDFAIDLKCGNKTEHLDFTQPTVGSSTQSFSEPAGTVCSVSEKNARGATSTAYSGAATAADQQFTIVSGQTSNVTVTNHFDPAKITVTKDVVGPAPQNPFSVSVACPGVAGSPFTFTIADNGSHDVTGLPGNAQCTVTETNTQGATSTTYNPHGAHADDPPTISTTVGGAATVAITNTFPTVPGTGNLSITKALDNKSGTTKNGPFTGTWTCTGASTSSGNFSLTPGQTQTINSIAAPSTCTVTETGTAGADSVTYAVTAGQAGANSAAATITDGVTTTVTITNHYNPPPTGTLNITKALDNQSGTPKNGPYTGTWACANNQSGTFSVAPNGTQSFSISPVPTTCTVTETGNGGAASVTYAVTSGSTTASSATANMTDGNTTTVTITNHFNPPPPPGALEVDKVVSGSGAGTGGPFVVDVNCGGSHTTLTFTGSGTQTVSPIAAGTSCTVTETSSSGATSVSYTVGNGAPGATPPSVVIGSGQTATVTVTNTFTPAGAPVLGISKSADPVSGTVVHRGDTITYTLDYANTGTADATGVSIVDTLPADVDFVSASLPGPGVYNAGTGTVTWTIGTLAAGATGSVSYVVTVAQSAFDGEVLHNVAVISGSGQSVDSNATDHPVVVPTQTLGITKFVDKTAAEYGDNLAYSLVVTAGGNADQTNVVVTDNVPTGTTFVSSSCGVTVGCTTSQAAGVVTWTIAALAHGQSATVTFVVNITKPNTTPLPAKTINNGATVMSDQVGSTPSNVVHTSVIAVLGEQIVKPSKPSPPSLPFTGTTVPVQPAMLAAIGFVLLGAIVLAVGLTGRRPAPEEDGGARRDE